MTTRIEAQEWTEK